MNINISEAAVRFSQRVVHSLVVALVLMFALYVFSEKRIDLAHEQRFQMRMLANELRQSSDELTRMARTYVLTGSPLYKRYFVEILEIREGKRPRPARYDGVYWDLVLASQVPRQVEEGRAVALLTLLSEAGASAEELELLGRAKTQSDALTQVEYEAMAMVEMPGGTTAERRNTALQRLHDSTYLLAKAAIMEPVNQFYSANDRRTQQAVEDATRWAYRIRLLVIGLGLLTLAFLAYSNLLLRRSENARRKAEHKLLRLSQIYAALSECSQGMVRCSSHAELYALVCQAAVRHGAIRLAWIGLIDGDGSRVSPVAMQGEGTEYVKGIDIRTDPNLLQGQGPSAIAIREDRPYWCQDFQHDSNTVMWRDRARKYGWLASASLPLHRNGQVVGVFNLYAEETHAFDEQIQGLLQEMAADVDYAVHALEQEAARLEAQAKTLESENRLQLAYRGSHDALWDWNLQTGALHYAPRWWEMIGLQPNSLPLDEDLWKRVMHPADLPRIKSLIRQHLEDQSESFETDCRIQHADGHYVPILVRAFITRDAEGRPIRVSGTNMDLSERVRTQQTDALRSMMLERLTSNMTQAQVLDAFARSLGGQLDDALCAIVLRQPDGEHVVVGAAAGMPEGFATLLEQAPLAASSGPCHACILLGESVQALDLALQPYVPDYLAFMERNGLVSCWAEPIRSGSGEVLGCMALYRTRRIALSDHEQALLSMAAHITGIAIERKHAEQQLELTAKVFEQGGELIMIADAQGRLVRVNHAFTRITGYSAEEALGNTPSMLSSGKQDADFYRAMWATLNSEGHWQGEVWNRRKDGTLYPEWLSISRLLDASGEVTHYVGTGSDITQRKQDEEKIRMLADYDPLTGLPNRRLLRDRVALALAQAHRKGHSVTLIFLDLDRFKNVNDSLGHHVGDELLTQVASRLKAAVREQDTVCRMGGDEFVLLCPDTDAVGAGHLASKLLEELSRQYAIEGQDLSITGSLGIAMFPNDGDTFEALSMRADTAMYRAKQGGRNAFCFFAAGMQQQSARVLQLENALRRALDEGQLTQVYQPQVDMLTGAVVGVEALLRWNHPVLGPVSPAEFIPVAEDSGLIHTIGEWTLRNAVRQMRQWQEAGLPLQLVAVNLSAVQFRHPDLPDLVTRILEDEGLPAECLELELTEGVALEDPVGAIAIMARLHERGVRMSIDDFGTGYSSLSYLKRFHVYKLKIDQSFVRDLMDDKEDLAIVVAIIGLARSLGFLTIAEGVETEGQLELLRQHGCDEVQGYHFSRPLAADALAAFVRAHPVQRQPT